MKAINTAKGISNAIDEGGDIAKTARKKQPLQYVEGQSEAGNNNESVDGIVDLSTKAPYGRSGMGSAENSGKLGDLDPQETDQPSWVGTWGPLQEGPNGAGPVRDENYPVQRPRTYSRLRERFEECNPEFQDVADRGDWTSLKWSNKV